MARPTYQWFNTLLKVRDGTVSSAFYVKHFGMTLLNRYEVAGGIKIFYLATLPAGMTSHPVGSPEAHKQVWTDFPGTLLELLELPGTAALEKTPYHSGNTEPYRGFGHIAFNTPDVYAASADLEAAGVAFQKRPDEGRMKGLAFALDPDGYWIELVRRSEAVSFPGRYNLSQTMLRVKDPKKSLAFYRDLLGLPLVSERSFEAAAFSLFFLGGNLEDTPVAAQTAEEPLDTIKRAFWPLLELTHNHGTETQEDFSYWTGTGADGTTGFGSIGFLVDDPAAATDAALAAGASLIKRHDDGIQGMAIVGDPDGYPVKFYKRGGMFNETL